MIHKTAPGVREGTRGRFILSEHPETDISQRDPSKYDLLASAVPP